MYKSKYLNSKDAFKEQVFNPSITDNEVKDIEASIERIKDLLSFADYYLMVRDNCLDFINDCKSNGPGNDKTFIRSNRLFLNALNSYYVWQEYGERHSINSAQRDYIHKIKNHGVLELANRIRHKGVHDNTPITSCSFDVLKEVSSFHIQIESLFTEKERSSFNKKIHKYIGEGEIEAVTFIRDFLSEFNKLNLDIWNTLSSDYENDINTLLRYVPVDALNMYNSEITNDNGTKTIHIGRTLELVAIKLELINASNSIDLTPAYPQLTPNK